MCKHWRNFTLLSCFSWMLSGEAMEKGRHAHSFLTLLLWPIDSYLAFLFSICAETPEKEGLASCWLQPPVFKCWNTWPDVIQFHKICPELVKNNYFFSEKLTCKISFGRPDYSAVWIECATSLMTAFCLNWWMTLCLANLWHYFPLGIPFGLSITAKISELNHLVVLELHISPQ